MDKETMKNLRTIPPTLQTKVTVLYLKVCDNTIRKRQIKYGSFGGVAGTNHLLFKKNTAYHHEHCQAQWRRYLVAID